MLSLFMAGHCSTVQTNTTILKGFLKTACHTKRR